MAKFKKLNLVKYKDGFVPYLIVDVYKGENEVTLYSIIKSSDAIMKALNPHDSTLELVLNSMDLFSSIISDVKEKELE